jgi:hypothetical protein
MGITGGYCMESFTTFAKKQNYDANYHFKNGVAFSFFHESKMDSTINLKIELQYKLQNADMKIKNDAGKASFYTNMDYSFHLFNLNLSPSFRIIEKKMFKMNFLLGMTLAYNITTTAIGNGWESHYVEQVDTNGNFVHVLTTRDWEKNERNSKDLSKFNVGIDIGLDFIIPVNNRMDFLLQNRYNIFFTNIMTLKYFRYTSLFTGILNIGFRYKFTNDK